MAVVALLACDSQSMQSLPEATAVFVAVGVLRQACDASYGWHCPGK